MSGGKVAMTAATGAEGDVKARLRMSRLALNERVLQTREALLKWLSGDCRDYNKLAGYPTSISAQDYKDQFDRNGVAARVVSILPEESWQQDPEVYETEDTEEVTPFEEAFSDMETTLNVFHFLQRIDTVSGIGRFGILFLGYNDSKPLSAPVAGANRPISAVKPRKKKAPPADVPAPLVPPVVDTPGGNVRINFLRAFDESCVSIKARESDTRSPRYGKPVMYSVTFQSDEQMSRVSTGGGVIVLPSSSGVATQVPQPGGLPNTAASTTVEVHWTRIIHVADDRLMSEVYGVPRQQRVFNRLLDIAKILSGAAEMFWQAGFPTYSIEAMPDVEEVESDSESISDQMQSMMNTNRRWIELVGMTAKSLSPTVNSPEKQYETAIRDICISLGVPMRVFMGSEQAVLASSQDAKAWVGRLTRRQQKYITPMIIKEFVDRCILTGVLPTPGDDWYTVDWPDLAPKSDDERANTALKKTQAMAAYVAGNVDQLLPPRMYLSLVHGYTMEEIDQAETETDEFEDLLADDPEPVPGGGVPPGNEDDNDPTKKAAD